MLKAGSFVLISLLVFAVVFALLPTKADAANTGVTLQDVTLTLYPTSDPDAYWVFKASEVQNDPLAGQTHLRELKEGGRWVWEQNADGSRSEKSNLDATLEAGDLVIDSQDNLTTPAATIKLVQECANVVLKGNEEKPVQVAQIGGFSAPYAQVDSPAIKGEVFDLRMTFDFEIQESSEQSNFGWDMNSTEECVNGQRVNTAAGNVGTSTGNAGIGSSSTGSSERNDADDDTDRSDGDDSQDGDTDDSSEDSGED